MNDAVEVIWDGVLVGHLHDVSIDNTQIYGRWESAGVPAFEEAFRATQVTLSGREVCFWEADFRTPGQLGPLRRVALVIQADRPYPKFRVALPPVK